MSIEDYLKWVRQTYNSKQGSAVTKHLFFRGHSKTSYKLEPSVFRKVKYDEKEEPRYRYKEREVMGL